MKHHSKLTTLLFLAAFVVFNPGCGGLRFRSPITSSKDEHRTGPGQMTTGAIQSEVMAFTDTFNSAVAQAWNQVAAEGRAESAPSGLSAPNAEKERASRLRRAALESKLAAVSSSLSIASCPNPTIALSDLITMITLQRMVIETPGSAALYGPQLQESLLATYREQEDNAWKIAAKAMTPEQQQELKGLIQEWRAAHPDATYVTNVRLGDFAGQRQQTRVSTHSSGSLLSLLGVDPLASLDPAEREVQKSRLLGERMFYYASRSPQILKWQVESLYQDLMRAPEFKQALASAENASNAAARISAVAEKLPTDIKTARAEALDQAFAQLAQERHAAIVEVIDALGKQRTDLTQDLDQAQGKLQDTLKEYNAAALTTDKAAASLTTTIQSADALLARFTPAPGAPAKDPNRDPLADVNTALAKTGDVADRLSLLTRNLDQLLASPGLNDKGAALRAAVLDVQLTTKQVIDYAFMRLLILAVVAPLAAAFAAGLYKWVVRRP